MSKKLRARRAADALATAAVLAVFALFVASIAARCVVEFREEGDTGP